MASQIRQWMTANKVSLELLVRQGLNLCKQLTPSESAEYRAWRHRFLQDRLSLCIKLAFAILLTFSARDLYEAISPLLERQPQLDYKFYLWLCVNPLTAMLVFAGLVLQKTALGRRYPSVLLLCLSWSTILFPQALPTLWDAPETDIDVLTSSWELVFMAQAILIPVCWWLHLLSQLGVVAHLFGLEFVLGQTINWGKLNPVTFFLYIFWFFSICDLAVYLYERLQRNEFQSRRELRVFLHSVSHDLRAPVMGTSIVLQNLLKKSEDKISVNRSVLEQLLQGSDRQLKLLESLLEAHSTEVQGIVLHRQPCQLSTLVQSVLLDLQPLLTKNRVMVTNQLSADLPLLHADPTQLWRVFSNLMTNALKHNPPEIQLTLDATVKAEVIRCSVQDDGVGMSSEQCRRVFELYVRGNRARYMPGLGLGLYLCQQIVAAHGGEIGVISSPGAGSTFWFTLPLD